MEFVRFSPEIAKEWDDLVYHSDDGWLYSLSCWLQMTGSIAELGYEDHSFAVYQNGKMVAVMPLQKIRHRGLASVGYLTAGGPAGPVVDSAVHPHFREKLLAAIYTHVESVARQLCVPRVTVGIPALSRSSLNNARGVNPLVKHGFQDISAHTWIINLQKPDATLFSELAQDSRQKIRAAEKAGYTVDRGSWPDLFDEYWRVQTETYHRLDAEPLPKAYFEGIANRIAPRGHAALWAGRSPSGKPIAFHNAARFGQTSYYWNGCCESGQLESGINYALCWHAMLGAKREGCLWFEMGPVYPGLKEGKDRGLTVFKSKFGGELHRSFEGRMIVGPDVRAWWEVTLPFLRHLLGRRVAGHIANAARFVRYLGHPPRGNA